MKRIALATFVLGIVLVLAPVAQAHVMSDDSAGGNAVTLMTDTLGGGGGISTSVAIRPDILGGDGGATPVPIRTDTLSGNGGNSDVVLWLTNELAKDRAADQATIISSSDSFTWGETATVGFVAALLLAITATAVTRRRHRLSF